MAGHSRRTTRVGSGPKEPFTPARTTPIGRNSASRAEARKPAEGRPEDPAPRHVASFRRLTRGEGGCAFTFLLGKQPDWSVEQFQSEGIPGMVHECEVLAGLIEARAAA